MAIIPAADVSSAVIDITTGLVGGSFVPLTRNINTTFPLTGGGNLASDLTLALTTSPPGQIPVGVTRSIATTPPLAGGGDLSANRTLSVGTFDAANSGVVPASGGGTTNFLRADGTWQAVAGGTGVPATRLINTTPPLTGGGDLSADRTLGVNDFTAVTNGTVPASGGGSVNFLRADGAWVPVSTSAVNLQPTTPGSTDSGHVHISGVLIAESGITNGTETASLPIPAKIMGQQTDDTQPGLMTSRNANVSSGAILTFRKSRGSVSAPSAGSNGDVIGTTFLRNYSTGLGLYGGGEAWRAVQDGADSGSGSNFAQRWLGGNNIVGNRVDMWLTQLGVHISNLNPVEPTPTGRLQVGGALAITTTSKTGTYTTTIDDGILIVDATGGSFTVTLPNPTTCAGRLLYVRRVDAVTTNSVTISCAQGIDYTGSLTLYGVRDSVLLVSNGIHWYSMPFVHGQYYSQIANSTAVANTAAKTALGPLLTLDAQLGQKGCSIRYTASGIFSTTGAPTLRMQFEDGGTQIFADSLAQTMPNTVTNAQWQMEGMINFTSNTAGRFGGGRFEVCDSNGLMTAYGTRPSSFGSLSNGTYGFYVQWGTADPANTITLTSFNFETIDAGQTS